MTSSHNGFTERAAETQEGNPEPPLGVLIGGLAEDLRQLFGLELALFKREMADNASRFNSGLVLLAIGLVLAFTAWLAIFATAVIALTIVWPTWLAAAVVGAASSLSAGLLLYFGVRLIRVRNLVPRRTLNALRQEGEWTKERVT